MKMAKDKKNTKNLRPKNVERFNTLFIILASNHFVPKAIIIHLVQYSEKNLNYE